MVCTEEILMEVLGARMTEINRLDHTDDKPRSYIAATTFGDLIFPCGQIPVDDAGTTPESIQEQTKLCLQNLSRTIINAGGSLATVLQITVYLSKVEDFEGYDAAYRESFGELALPPRTTLFVQTFRGQKRIELTAIAAKEGQEDHS